MKVGSAPPQPLPPRPAPQSAEPSRPFAEFLAESDARAAGFAELGMFGRSQAVAAPSPAIVHQAPRPGDAPAPEAPARPAVATPRTLSASIGETPAAEIAPASHDPVICALPRAAPAKQDPGTICSLPGEAERQSAPREEPAGPQARARTSRPRLRQPAPHARVSLALHEENGGVEIVAGAPPIDPEARGQLRRLVEAILARSGLTLAQFKLNGAPAAPDNLGKTGGRHGPRPN